MDYSQLAGPLGGAIAAAFGGGCIAGYGFCVRTILKISNSRISSLEETVKEEKAECDRRIARLEWKLERAERRHREMSDMMLGKRSLGMFSPDLEGDMPPDSEIDRQINRLGE